jgi:hypothetical protein
MWRCIAFAYPVDEERTPTHVKNAYGPSLPNLNVTARLEAPEELDFSLRGEASRLVSVVHAHVPFLLIPNC